MYTEWSNEKVYRAGTTIKKQNTSLRKKISKHKSSTAHLMNAQKIINECEKKIIDKDILTLSAINQENTARIFRTDYLIAKNQCLYTDLPKLINLQELNRIDMGRVLQCKMSCSNIIDHLALEMRKKITIDIIKSNRKICGLTDESLTLS